MTVDRHAPAGDGATAWACLGAAWRRRLRSLAFRPESFRSAVPSLRRGLLAALLCLPLLAGAATQAHAQTLPLVSFAISSQTVDEGSGTHNVKLTLSPAPTSDITIAYRVRGTATLGSDFRIAGSGTGWERTLTVSRGATTATIPVTIIDDTEMEGREDILLQLMGGTGYRVNPAHWLRVPSVMVLYIPHSDVPVMSFATGSHTAFEGAGTHNVRVTLNPAPTSDITLAYLVGGTATSGSDFTIAGSGTGSARTLSVPGGTTTATIPVTIIDDSAKEDSETVILTLIKGAGSYHPLNRSHTLTIVDNDGPSAVSFASGTYRVSEGDPWRPELVLSRPRSEDVTVMVETLDLGGAQSGEDFAAGPWSVIVPAGQTRHRFSIATFKDDKGERDEEVLLHIPPYGHSPGVYRSSSGTADAVAVIKGNTRVSLPYSSYTVSEGGTALILVAMENPKSTAFTLDYTLTGDTRPGFHFTTASPSDVVDGFGTTRSVTIPANARLANIPVETVQDKIQGEDLEAFSFWLSTSEPDIVIGGGGTKVWIGIRDDDGPAPRARFASLTSSAEEDSGMHYVTVNLSAPLATDITLNYEVEGTRSSRATPDVDYVALPGTLSVPAGSTSATIPVTIIDDAHEDSRESILLYLRDGEGYRAVYSSHLIWILNHEQDDLEGLVQARIDAAANGGDASAANLWRRALATVQGEAPPNGLAPLTEAEARAQADAETAKGNTALAALWTDIAYMAGAATPQSPAISEVAIAGGADTAEGGDAVFTLTATPAPETSLTVDVTVTEAGGYAAAGTHQVTIPAGGTAQLSVATAGDAVDEPDGAVTATLAAGDGYTVSSAAGAASVTVTDDDATTVTLTTPDTTAAEGDADDTASIVLTLGRGLVKGESLAVPLGFAGGAAGTDFTLSAPSPLPAGAALSGTTVAFAGPETGESTASITLTLAALADADTTDRTVTVSIPSSSTGSAPTLTATGLGGGAAGTRTGDGQITLEDPTSDAPPDITPEVGISGGGGVTEGGDAVFTVTATPAPSGPLAVNVTVSTDGDFGIAGGGRTVTIPATTGSFTLTLPTTDDTTDEPDGTVTAVLAAGAGYTVSATAGSAGVAVTDDDEPVPATPTGVDPALIAEVKGHIAHFKARNHGAGIRDWTLILDRLEGRTGMSDAAIAAWLARSRLHGWQDGIQTLPKVQAALAALETAPEPVQQPATLPVVSISAGDAVTEGGNAAFTLTATPPPPADLTVTVSVSADGDYGITGGSRTVTIPTGGSFTLTLPTADDATDEPDGSVTVTVADGAGYTVGSSASGTVAVRDDDEPLPEVTIAAGASPVTEGGDAVFTLTASPLPASPLAVSVSVAADGDYGIAGASRTVTIPTAGSFTLTLPTADDAADEPDGSVTVTVNDGNGYTVGSSASGTVSVQDDDLPPPAVSITAAAASVTEGGAASFTVSADRAPDADLTITLSVTEAAGSDHVAADDEGRATVTIAKGATEASFPVATVNDAVDEPDGSVTVTLKDGAGYTVSSSQGAATVSVSDNDAAAGPVLSVADATVTEGDWAEMMPFAVRLSAAQTVRVRVRASTRVSSPVSARPKEDYWPLRSELVTFYPGETEKTVWVYIYNDSHDEDPETFEVVLSDADGATIGDGVAVGTIVNDDPMPAAWLARFGRTVAEQALDGIAARMAAPRTAGMQGSIAGQALSFDPAASGNRTAAGSPAPGGTGALALADVARSFDSRADRFGNGGFGGGPGSLSGAGFGNGTQSRTMTARDALLGSSFSLTGEADGSGGSMAFWGRAAQGSFDGREGTFSLDGAVITGMLGADYARGKWLVGLALAQSTGEGDYRDSDVSPRPDGQTCPADAEDGPLCGDAVRAGDGSVEASLTAAIPYAALQASERLKLWGAAGYGTGEVTLKTAMGGSYKADTTWSMAAAGLRGDLLAPPEEGSGPALAVTSDALWTRTSSEKTRDLAASDSDATRLRLGLEGSYRMALEGGGHPGSGSGASITPKLEIGARHDGGDAETGFGVELGGGVAWVDPGLGLSLDVSGRTLIAHGNDDLKDRGYAASLAFDPDPATRRGPSLSLRQEFGGQAQGGLDALFHPAALEDRTGGEATSRWSMEAAYGFPAFGGRWTGSPHVGLGLATGARDYSLGWRLTPEAASAPDLSFGLRATRRESGSARPEHVLGIEATARW